MTLGEKIYQAIMNINSDAQFVSKITNKEKEEFDITWVNTTSISKADIKTEMDKL
tara:strand:- start:711 stop:875 length:165 start_codon:yes stop_codon:yes gene_type:complete